VLSEKILLGEFPSGTTIVVDVDEENEELTFEAVDTPDGPPVEMAEADE